VNWVLDSDIQGFFDAMVHSWTIRFLAHRIADKRILRLIAKWLKGGITEDGRVTTHQSERGCFLTKRHNFKEGRTSLSTIGRYILGEIITAHRTSDQK
jgi:hypothetical protein